MSSHPSFFFFFLNDPAPPEISPFPLPAALPFCPEALGRAAVAGRLLGRCRGDVRGGGSVRGGPPRGAERTGAIPPGGGSGRATTAAGGIREIGRAHV